MSAGVLDYVTSIISFYVYLAFSVISELIHYSAARNLDGISVQMPLIQVLVPQVMNLKAQLRDPEKVSYLIDTELI